MTVVTAIICCNSRKFKKKLWPKSKQYIRDKCSNIEFLWRLELNTVVIQAIIEHFNSRLSPIYNPSMKISTLKKTLKKLLYLSKNLKQRELIVQDIARLSLLIKSGSGSYSNENYINSKKCKVKQSTVIDNYESYPVDQPTVLKCVPMDMFKQQLFVQ